MLKKLKSVLAYDYVVNYKQLTIIYLLLSFILLITTKDGVSPFLTIYSLSLIFLAVVFSFLSYKLVNPYLPPEKTIIKNVWMTTLDPRYLVSKLSEILLQQLFLTTIFVFSVVKLPNSSLITFLMLFVSIHLTLLLNRKLKIAIVFTLLSIVVGMLFYKILVNYRSFGLGINYMLHIFLYIIGGVVVRIFYKKTTT